MEIDRREAATKQSISGAELSSLTISGTTDDAVANNFVEYDVDVYFATEGKALNPGGFPSDFPARQLNINTAKLPGVDRNEEAVNKRPILVEGRLYARPLFRVSGSSGDKFDSNPQILTGRLVTPLGTDLGGLGELDDVALFDNGVFNLEPNVNQNYKHVATYKYLEAMPGSAPASRTIDQDEYTNLMCFGLTNPDGTVWKGGDVAFRFVLKYRVPVVLTSQVEFLISVDGPGALAPDGILCVARNIKDVICPAYGASLNTEDEQQVVYPDARKIIRQ